MRPTEFEDKDIIAAGEKLQSQGRNVTGFSLRQQVGGGSAARLKQVWETHLRSQSAASAVPLADLPMEVEEQFSSTSKSLLEQLRALVLNLNDQAVKAAERRVTELMKSASEQTAAAERELSDASTAVDTLESQLDESKAAQEVLSKQVAELTVTAQQQAVEIAELRTRLGACQSALQEAKMEADKLAPARQEAARYQGQVEALEGQLAALRGHAPTTA